MTISYSTCVTEHPSRFLVSLAVIFILWPLWRRLQAIRSAGPNSLPLPPGPRPLPVIGNLLDVPTENMEVRFRDMSTRYGDVVYLNVFGQPMVVLGTHEVAMDLLDKRSAIYSDRKFSSMAELTGFSWLLGTIPYGRRWRSIRRNFHVHMSANNVAQYRSIQERQAARLLSRLLDHPQRFSDHGRYVIGAAILQISYGLPVAEKDDKYIHIAEEAIPAFNMAFLPGRYLVETFPRMRYIPSWLPLAKFKREARQWRPAVLRMRNAPWEAATKAIADGFAPSSMASSLQAAAKTEEDVEVAKDSAASVYLGGSDTILSTLQTFFAAIATHPDVQKQAQAELDAIVGPGRLPVLDDKLNLPYVTAVVKECLRWKSVTPLGLAHRSTEEDEYKGYRIPKGSVVLSNTWAYSRDPRFYSDPEEFKPERFLKDGQLDPDVLDPHLIAFGYGRRICPGLHFATTMLFALISSVLHTFRISLPLDERGKPVALDIKMTLGVISYVEPFECRIEPRSSQMEALIRASQQDAGVLTE